MKFFIRTFGCQMNISDSKKIESILLSNPNFSLAENINNANLVIVNTCSVRKHAEERVESFVGELKKYKIQNPKLKIIIVGCYAQKSKLELKKKFSYIDNFIGTLEYDYLPEILSKILKTPIKKNKFLKTKTHNISAFVPVMTGCNNYCSYCIVPYVRGKECSRTVEEILSEVKYLLNSGVKEIILLGQNVNSYRGENSKNQYLNFAQLLEKIATIYTKNKFWIRFMTNHPKDMNEEIVSTIKKYPNICHHIHLPLQSGSDKILKLMNRKYTSKKYYNLIKLIRKKIPDIAITTDLIVGFPKESERDFMKTYNMVKKIQFDSAFVFKYSARDGTKASKLKDTVDKNTKQYRHYKLLSLCETIAKKVNSKYINKEIEVLVTGYDLKQGYIAKTFTNKTINIKNFSNKKINPGFVKVRILETKKHNLIGKII